MLAENRNIGEHQRVFTNCKWQLDPLHYLDLIGERPGSPAGAATGWDFTVLPAWSTGWWRRGRKESLERVLAKLSRVQRVIIDELGYIPFSEPGAQLLYQVFANRYERASLLVTSNLAFAEWTPGLR